MFHRGIEARNRNVKLSGNRLLKPGPSAGPLVRKNLDSMTADRFVTVSVQQRAKWLRMAMSDDENVFFANAGHAVATSQVPALFGTGTA